MIHQKQSTKILTILTNFSTFLLTCVFFFFLYYSQKFLKQGEKMRHSFLKMVVLAFMALGLVACGDASASSNDKKANKASNVKQQALQSLEKLCDEGVSEICYKLAHYEKGCNGNSEYGEKYIGESCNKIANIYAQKLEGDKAKPYYAKACEKAGSCGSRLKELDESLYIASKDLYDSRKRKEAEAQREKQEKLEQEKSQKELTQTCESDDEVCKCENGDGKACYSLRSYSDDKQAMYQKGCENGSSESCYLLGDIYKRKLDGKQAKAYYQKGCEYGSYWACDLLDDIEKDKEKLAAIFKKICDSGVGVGCYSLGKIYQGNKNYKQAIAPYAKTCGLGVMIRESAIVIGEISGCDQLEYIYDNTIRNSYGRDFESEAYWLGYHRGDSKKAKQSVKEVKQIKNEVRGELLKYLPNLCKIKGGKTCDLLWKIGNN